MNQIFWKNPSKHAPLFCSPSLPPSLPPSVPFPLSPSPSHTLSITNTNTNTHFGHPMDVPLALWDKHRSLALARILLLSLYRVLPRARARSLSLFLSPSVNYLLILIIAVRLESSKQLKEAPPVCNLGGGNANQRNCGVLSCMPFVSQWLISLLHIRSCNSAFTLVHTLRVRGNRSMRKEADVVMQESNLIQECVKSPLRFFCTPISTPAPGVSLPTSRS